MSTILLIRPNYLHLVSASAKRLCHLRTKHFLRFPVKQVQLRTQVFGSPALDQRTHREVGIPSLRLPVMNSKPFAAVDVDVTAHNFEKVLPDVEEALKTCDYVAVDGEFTGLHLTPPGKEEFFDSVEQQYARIKLSAQSFLIMQFGLSMVEWSEERQCNLARTFNFYIFPQPYGSFSLRFSCQASSLAFLREHNFDFNKFIYDGVPYLSLEQLQKEERRLASARPPRPSGGGPIVLTRSEEQAFLDAQLARVAEWVRTTSPPSPDAAPEEQQAQQLQLEASNSYLRAAVYQALALEYGKSHFFAESVQVEGRNVGSGGGSGSAVVLTRATAEGVAALEAAAGVKKLHELHRAAGFALVVRALARCGKPVVGHNMVLDLAYMFQQFVAPLPPTFEEFRRQLRALLPGGVVDTKYLAKQLPGVFGGGSSLETVYSTVTRPQLHDAGEDGGSSSSPRPIVLELDLAPDAEPASAAAMDTEGAQEEEKEENEEEPKMKKTTMVVVPQVLHAPGFVRYHDASMAHEAGYDAFMTAAAFAGLAQLLDARTRPDGIAQGPVAEPDRSHVYLLSSMASDISQTDIVARCRDLGLASVRLIWVDKTSAYISLQGLDDSEAAQDRVEALREAMKPAKMTAFADIDKSKHDKAGDGAEPAQKKRPRLEAGPETPSEDEKLGGLEPEERRTSCNLM
eukprot:jgi/Mesen1/3240/ME000187S02405